MGVAYGARSPTHMGKTDSESEGVRLTCVQSAWGVREQRV